MTTLIIPRLCSVSMRSRVARGAMASVVSISATGRLSARQFGSKGRSKRSAWNKEKRQADSKRKITLHQKSEKELLKERIAAAQSELTGKYPPAERIEKGPKSWHVPWDQIFGKYKPDVIARWVRLKVFRLKGPPAVKDVLILANSVFGAEAERLYELGNCAEAEWLDLQIRIAGSATSDLENRINRNKDRGSEITKAAGNVMHRERYLRDMDVSNAMTEIRQKRDELLLQPYLACLSEESQLNLIEMRLGGDTMRHALITWGEEHVGESMLPALVPGVSNTISIPLTPKTVRDVKKGQIVSFFRLLEPIEKETPSTYRFARVGITKRIVAIEGDVVEFQGKRCTVPDDHVWVLGDNPDKSTDSRHFGAVPLQNLRSLVLYEFTLDPFEYKSVDKRNV